MTEKEEIEQLKQENELLRQEIVHLILGEDIQKMIQIKKKYMKLPSYREAMSQGQPTGTFKADSVGFSTSETREEY